VASNDKDCVASSVWESLVQRQDITSSEGEVKTEVIPENDRRLFHCYGINGNIGKQGKISLRNIRMWV
jgi:hypothetical protein